MLNQSNKLDINDIIFEGKNKDYGAYELRKFYLKRLLIALFMVVLIVFGLIFLPKKKPEPELKYKLNEIVLAPLKKIKEISILEKNTEQSTEKEIINKIQEVESEPKIEEVKNEAKLKIVEEKLPNDKVEKKIETDSKNNVPKESSQNNNSNANKGNTDNQDNNAIDGKSAVFPIIFPGCEKFSNDSGKLFNCFNNKMRDEVNYYLNDVTIKKKSREELYFEIDKNGDIISLKLIKGEKINDAIALQTLKKIALEYNRIKNPSKRIKPAKDASGKSVVVFYKLPISFEESEID